jgi:type VI protein secretion system component VasK
LFPDGGKQPNAEYQIALAPVKDSLVKIEIDGNVVSAPEKLSANFVWPGNKSGVKITVTPLSGQDLTKAFSGEWGLLRMFSQSGGGDGQGTQFVLQTPVQAAAVRMQIEPKSGGLFRRGLYSSLRAPKSITQTR